MFRTGDRVTTAATDVLVLAEGEGNAGGALAVVIVAFMVAAGFLLGGLFAEQHRGRWFVLSLFFAFCGLVGLNLYLTAAWSESELREAVKEAVENVDGATYGLYDENPIDDALARASDGRGASAWLTVTAKANDTEYEVSAQGTGSRFCIHLDSASGTEPVRPAGTGDEDGEPFPRGTRLYSAEWREGTCPGIDG
ncbi:hypothetical protein [Streptomyces sp. NPDC050804]|uniref:hypothetical protein n=1 Tax=Streptomyces sp. NPDC050804 TaxID=3154745 RepID=UPI0034310DBF